MPYGAPPSPVPKAYAQMTKKSDRGAASKYPSRHSSRSRTPDGSTECAAEPKKRPKHVLGGPRDGTAHVRVLNVSDQKDCSHLLAVLNVANQKESLRHVTSTGSYMLDSPEVVPECLNTFSDFYNPSVSAEERFDKYLAEMHRREKEVETSERLKVRNTSIGSFHYGKFGKKRKPFPLNGKKVVPPTPQSGLARAIHTSGDEYSFQSDPNLEVGQQQSKKPLAISTFSLLDIDKMRHKDSFGLPHTTR
ncbi:hypothetical protein LSH36_526g00016 [Paralvinella palmiformis]|uniref:Uncharacterized protein n=1 Tax=Paralvinella palmiformis TaxID=53620 RepID=A0AAD9J7A4_9ANNE|nr:hypothetical protein LSH36_526g00016 [Paralvinella palmiformis]